MDGDVQHLLERALAWRDANDPRRSYEVAARAAAIAPGEPRVHVILADLLLALDRTDDALEAAERAVALAPEDPDAHLVLARACCAGANDTASTPARTRWAIRARDARWREQIDRSHDSVCLALTLEPGRPDALYWLVRIQIRLGRLDAAVRTAAQIRSSSVALADAATIEIALARGQFDDVDRMASRRLAQNPSDTYAHNLLVRVAERRSQPIVESQRLVAAARAGDRGVAKRLHERAKVLMHAPTTLHLAAGIAAFICAGLTVGHDPGRAEVAAGAATAAWLVAWIAARRRQGQIMAAFAVAGRAALLRAVLVRAFAVWVASTAAAAIAIAGGWPDREDAIAAQREAVCKFVATPCDPAIVEAVVPVSTTLPTVQLADGRSVTPDPKVARTILAPFQTREPPVIVEAAIRRELATARYAFTAGAGAALASAVMLLTATADLLRVRRPPTRGRRLRRKSFVTDRVDER